MVFIYTIQLEKAKYYIGKTNDPQFRLENHFNSNGSEWTKLYKPIRLFELKPDCDDFDEDKTTIQYMVKYGVDNVRGGSFVSVKLDSSTINILHKMINNSTDKCFVCKKPGHFAKDCKGYKKGLVCEYCGKEFMEEEKYKKHKKCNVDNKQCNCPTSYFSPHRESKCMLKRVILNSEMKPDDEPDNNNVNNTVKKNNCCFRCGRNGHYIIDCYASTHINGFSLV